MGEFIPFSTNYHSLRLIDVPRLRNLQRRVPVPHPPSTLMPTLGVQIEIVLVIRP